MSDNKAEFYMQMWFKGYGKFRYKENSIWYDNTEEFKQMFRDVGFIVKASKNAEYVSLILHPELEGKEHEWVFQESMYRMITNNYITLYRKDAVRDYLKHVKELLK